MEDIRFFQPGIRLSTLPDAILTTALPLPPVHYTDHGVDHLSLDNFFRFVISLSESVPTVTVAHV